MSDTEIEITPYAVGLVAASVCTNGTPEQAIAYMDEHHPTGMRHGWSLSSNVFMMRDGTGEIIGEYDSNTIPCYRNPDTHTHYLLQC
jgi:hypothetical protein